MPRRASSSEAIVVTMATRRLCQNGAIQLAEETNCLVS